MATLSTLSGTVSAGKGISASQATAVNTAVANLNAGIKSFNAGQVTGSSDSARASASATGSEISNLLSRYQGTDNSQALRDAGDAYARQIEAERAALTARRDAEVANLEKSFADTKVGTEKAQNKEFAGRSTGLITSGGYLGNTESQQGVLQNLRETHRQELSALDTKKESAILQAKNAYDDRDFQLAREKLQQAYSVEKDVAAAKENFAKKSLDILKYQTDFADTQVKTLSNLSSEQLASLPDATFNNLDQSYSLPAGTMRNVITASQKVAEAKNAKETVDYQRALLNMMQDIPEGQTITMPNGTQYTGIGKLTDTVTYQEKNPNTGAVSIISYNKATGKVKVMGVGNFGASDSTGSVADITEQFNSFMYMAKNKDGKFDVDQFIKAYNFAKATNPKSITQIKSDYLDEKKVSRLFSPAGIAKLKQVGLIVN